MNARHFVKVLSVALLLSPTLVHAQILTQGQILPDLVPADLDVDKDCRIVVTLKNNGPAIVPDAGYSLSPPMSGVQMYKGGAPWGGIVLGGLDPTKQTQPVGGTVSYTWFPGLALTPGTHEVKLDVDNNNVIAESNELNNSLTEKLTCLPFLPDLQPTDMTLDADCRIDVTIRNNGPAPVPESGYTHPGGGGLQMYSDGAPWGGIVLGAFDPSPHLSQPVGGTKTYKWFSSLPLSTGSHTVKLYVDDSNNIAESNELNNSLTKTLFCPKGPDLVPTKISLQPISIRPGSPCQIVLTLQNIGTGNVPDAAYVSTAQGSSVDVFTDGAPWGGSILGGFDPTKLVQPAGGAITAPWFPLVANLKVAPGEHTIRVVLDANNIVVESNEANNSLTQRLTCGIVVQPPTTIQP